MPLHAVPQVCLAKAQLVESHSIATHLFILRRGALTVTLGIDPASAAVNTSAGQSMALVRSRTKGNLRFRALEQPGCFCGIYDPYDFHVRLPLEVIAVKHSQLFSVGRHELINVLEKARARDMPLQALIPPVTHRYRRPREGARP